MSILKEIISILVGGIGELGAGIGTGVSGLVQSIFLTTTETGSTLSVFGTIIIVFAAISLAIGLCRWVMGLVTSLGAKK